jgi:MFS family permease
VIVGAMMSRPGFQLAVVGIGTAAVQLDTAVNIAFPAITRAFARGVDEVGWVVVGYVLTYAMLLLVCGRLGDRLGHGRVFRLGLAITAAAQLFCAAAGDFALLLVARVLQGIGAALVLSVGPALATLLFPESRRTWALGRYTTMIAIAATLGPFAGGILVELRDWPAVFWSRAPVALAALAMFRTPPAAGSTVAPRALRDLVALSRLAGFPTLNVASVLVNFAAFAVWLLVPFYLVRVAGIGAAQGGAMLSIAALGVLLASVLGARAIAALGAGPVCALGASTIGTGLLAIAGWEGDAGPWHLASALAVQGIGLGLFQLGYADIVAATLPRADRGVAGSLAHLTRTLGTVCAALVMMGGFAALEAGLGFLPAFQHVFVAAAVLAFAVGIFLGLTRRAGDA